MRGFYVLLWRGDYFLEITATNSRTTIILVGAMTNVADMITREIVIKITGEVPVAKKVITDTTRITVRKDISLRESEARPAATQAIIIITTTTRAEQAVEVTKRAIKRKAVTLKKG